MPDSLRPSRRRLARAFALALPLVTVACLGDTVGPTPPEPYEGTWRLVRLGGDALPLREDSIEVLGETITMLYLGSGYLTDRWREHGAASTEYECTAWFTFTFSGGRIVARQAANQIPIGRCKTGVTDREFTLDGDTLRSTGGAAFQLGGRARVYVRN